MRGFVFLAFYSLHCTMVDSAGGQCIPGTYTLTSGASCIYCPIGKYKAGFGNVLSCTTCPAGTYAINTGSTACIACGTDCMPGYYSTGCTATNKGTCITCPVCTTDNYYTAGCTGNSPGTCTPCATCAAGTSPKSILHIQYSFGTCCQYNIPKLPVKLRSRECRPSGLFQRDLLVEVPLRRLHLDPVPPGLLPNLPGHLHPVPDVLERLHPIRMRRKQRGKLCCMHKLNLFNKSYPQPHYIQVHCISIVFTSMLY